MLNTDRQLQDLGFTTFKDCSHLDWGPGIFCCLESKGCLNNPTDMPCPGRIKVRVNTQDPNSLQPCLSKTCLYPEGELPLKVACKYFNNQRDCPNYKEEE